MKVRWPGFFAKFHELVGSLSVKYSSTLGSPSKGQGGMLAPKPCLHSSHCLHILNFFSSKYKGLSVELIRSFAPKYANYSSH
jgi:hypothetical protein